MKKAIIAIAGALIVVLILGYITLKHKPKTQIQPSFDAIPADVAFFIQTERFSDFIYELGNKTNIWKDILKIREFNTLKNYYLSAYQIIKNNSKIKQILNNNSSIIAVRRQGKTQVDILLVVSFKSAQDLKRFRQALTRLLLNYKIKIKASQYNNRKIYQFSFKRKTFYMSFSNGLFIFSPSRLFFESSLRQLNSTSSLSTIPEFAKISSYAGQTAIASIFINYENFNSAFINLISSLGYSRLGKIKKFANWAVYDISFDNEYLRFIGYTSSQPRMSKFIMIFNNLNPAKFSVDKILPNTTYEYIVFGFDSYAHFRQNYLKHLTAKDLNINYQEQIKNFKSFYGFDPTIELLNSIGQTVTLAKAYRNFSNKTYNYLIIKLNDISNTKDFLRKITKIYCSKKGYDLRFFKRKLKINQNQVINVYKLVDSSLFNLFFDQLGKLPKQHYYIFVNNYIVLSDDKYALQFFAEKFYNQSTLLNSKDYQEFRKNMTPKSNITYYLKSPFNAKNLKPYLAETGQKILQQHQNTFSAIQNFALQFYWYEDLFMSYLIFNYNPKQFSDKILWKVKTLADINTKPFIFINHYTGSKEIFVGDKEGNIYLIDKTGKVLFSKNIGEPIFSQIFMIDYYQNHKYQLLFATRKKIYIIDRLGRNVENFPVSLPASLTTSISVFDYEKDGNYRIFAPCANNKVYLYTKKGKINPGWLITQTSAPVENPVQHFTYKGKDYLVFADDIHTYILNRKGRTRIPVKRTFAKASHSPFFLIPADSKHPKPMFLTTTKAGNIALIDFLGNVFIVKAPDNFNNSHRFALKDINGDGNYEFMYIQDNKIQIYQEQNKNLKLINSYQFEGDINSDLFFYIFSTKNIKIGFTTTKNLIYLFTNTGNIDKGFPKPGTTPFTISQLYKNKKFNIITGNNSELLIYIY